MNSQNSSDQPHADSHNSDAKPPEARNHTSDRLSEKHVPTLLQFVLMFVLTAVGLFSAGALYLNRSLESTELRLNAKIFEATAPIKEQQAAFRFKVDELKLITSLLASKASGLSPDEKLLVNSMLTKISYEDVNNLLKHIPEHVDKRPLKKLIDGNEVVQTGFLKDLVWDGGDHPAQVRFIKVNNPNLDLSKIDLISEGQNSCRSKVLQSWDPNGNTIQVCESHLNSSHSLELTIVVKPESTRVL